MALDQGKHVLDMLLTHQFSYDNHNNLSYLEHDGHYHGILHIVVFCRIFCAPLVSPPPNTEPTDAGKELNPPL